MANPERGEVELAVKDKLYQLKLTNGGLRAVQKRTGKTFGGIARALADSDIEVISQVLFEGMQAFHSQQFKTLERVDRLIDDAGGFVNVVPTCLELMQLNMPMPARGDGAAADPLNAQTISTGNDSGLTPDESV